MAYIMTIGVSGYGEEAMRKLGKCIDYNYKEKHYATFAARRGKHYNKVWNAYKNRYAGGYVTVGKSNMSKTELAKHKYAVVFGNMDEQIDTLGTVVRECKEGGLFTIALAVVEEDVDYEKEIKLKLANVADMIIPIRVSDFYENPSLDAAVNRLFNSINAPEKVNKHLSEIVDKIIGFITAIEENSGITEEEKGTAIKTQMAKYILLGE